MSPRSFAGRQVAANAAKLGRPLTVLEFCIVEAGIRRGASAVFKLALWSVARAEVPTVEPATKRGLVPGGPGPEAVEAYREVAVVSEAQAYRDWAFLRAIFGEHLDEALDLGSARVESRAALRQLGESGAVVTVGGVPVRWAT